MKVVQYSNPLLGMKKLFDEGCINYNEFGFLMVENPVMASFYLLPKVHKGPKDNPPGRPIVSGNGTLQNRHPNTYIDSFIKPLVRKIPSFIEDATDVLNRIDTLTDIWSHILVTIGYRKTVFKYWPQGEATCLKSLPVRGNSTPSSDFLLKLTDWVIHNNLFLFMDEIFIQKIGFPMGSCFSSSYACLFLGLWEKESCRIMLTLSIIVSPGMAAILMMC